MRRRIQQALSDAQLQRNLDRILPKTEESRAASVSEVSNWEELRRHAHRVKAHTLSRLSGYLEELEQKVIEQGGKVVWAESADEATQFVLDLAHKREIGKIVKSKTMVGEEIHLNEVLERAGIEAVETDLGEYIVQLAGHSPSHIVAPALHLSRGQIARLFTEKLGMEPTEDAEQITLTARRHLREHFLSARLGISGVNFAVSETGTIVVVENEGNARLSVSVPEIHVALMGIEKVIPRVADLAVFLKLLARSATGQRMTSYVNFINGIRRPGELDGPSEFYLVLIDNGRSTMLEDELLRQILFCIRCGACLNVCPVYENIGGHAYGSTYSGPIGAILTPQLATEKRAALHPYLSSLCGACSDVCPVKIEIPRILLELRDRIQRRRNSQAARIPLEKLAIQAWAWVMCSPANYARVMGWARKLKKPFGRAVRFMRLVPPLSRWQSHRELPSLAAISFREIYRQRKEEE